MSLAVINLATNKTESIVSDHVRKIGQGEKGLTLEVIVMDADSSGYDLTNKIITFSENKVGGKIVVDSDKENFERLNDKAGRFRYKLADAVYAASGEAWFSISTPSGDVIDTTKSFNIDVIEDATIHVNNDNYVSTLTALETHYKSIIQRTEDDNAALLTKFNQQFQNAVNNGNNNIQKVINSANQLIANWNSQISNERQAFANLQNDWKNQTNKINSDYESQKKAIQSDANSQLADNKKAANDALAKLEKDKQAAIAQANVDFRNKLNTIQTDYNNWKRSTIADFQKQIDKLEFELSDDENRQADIQKAIDAANNAISKIKDVDFTQYAHFSDLIGYISDHKGNFMTETTGNANSIGEPGMYLSMGNIKNLPLSCWGILQVIGFTIKGDNNNHRKVQIFYPDLFDEMPYYRNVTGTGLSQWRQFASQDDIANIITQINSLGNVKKVNNKSPDSNGNVNLSSFENPDQVFNSTDTIDIDTFIKPGIYKLNDPQMISSINQNALAEVPGNSDGSKCGYLIIIQHDMYNVSQEIRIFNSNSYTVSIRFLLATSNTFRPKFERIITTNDYQNILGRINSLPISTMQSDISTALNRITSLENREIYHYSSSLSDAKSYSANNPQVLVGSK